MIIFRTIDENLVAGTFFCQTKFLVFHENMIFFLMGSRPGIFSEFLVILSAPGGLDDAKVSPKRVMADLGDPVSKC